MLDVQFYNKVVLRWDEEKNVLVRKVVNLILKNAFVFKVVQQP